MSLTSYWTAPPRGGVVCLSAGVAEDGGVVGKGLAWKWRMGARVHPTCGPGGDRLSRALRRSTMGPGGLNDRVRNGIGWGTPGIATRSTGRMRRQRLVCAVAVRPRRVLRRVMRGVFAAHGNEGEAIKPIERLVPVSFTGRPASTSGLSTWWSSTALKRSLVSRLVSRLDSFSGYLFHT